MKTNLIIVSIILSLTGLAQTNIDSTAIKNQQMIESLKNRINTIDNIGNGTNNYQKQIDELKAELSRQNDSITKLLGIINGLKKYAAENNSEKKFKSTVAITNTNKDEKLSTKALNDNDYNNYKKSDIDLGQYLETCNCSPLFFKPYQVELNYKTITDLNELIKNYETQPNANKIHIIGHADKSGLEEKNVLLSKQRAEHLRDYLIIASDKIKKEDIIIEWFGSSKPILNLPESKKDLNRRTEIVVQ